MENRKEKENEGEGEGRGRRLRLATPEMLWLRLNWAEFPTEPFMTFLTCTKCNSVILHHGAENIVEQSKHVILFPGDAKD